MAHNLLEMFVLARTVSVDSVAEGLHSSSEATCEVLTKKISMNNVVQRRLRPKKPINQRLSRGKAGMLGRVRTVGAGEHRSVLSLEQNAIRYTIPYVKLELALLLSCSQRLLF